MEKNMCQPKKKTKKSQVFAAIENNTKDLEAAAETFAAAKNQNPSLFRMKYKPHQRRNMVHFSVFILNILHFHENFLFFFCLCSKNVRILNVIFVG